MISRGPVQAQLLCDCNFFADLSNFSPKDRVHGFGQASLLQHRAVSGKPQTQEFCIHFPAREKVDQTQETFGVGFSAILVPRQDGAGQLNVDNLSHLAPGG